MGTLFGLGLKITALSFAFMGIVHAECVVKVTRDFDTDVANFLESKDYRVERFALSSSEISESDFLRKEVKNGEYIVSIQTIKHFPTPVARYKLQQKEDNKESIKTVIDLTVSAQDLPMAVVRDFPPCSSTTSL